jgi:universal stress protein A
MKFKPTTPSGGVLVELGPKEPQLPTPRTEPVIAPLPVFQLKKILVPTDFSECAKKALQYAIPLAGQFDAELTLLHVVQPYPPALEMPPVDPYMIQDAEQEMKAFRGIVGDAVSAKTVLRTGTPCVEIVEAAKELGSDLIILSTHGRTGLAHVFLGSTTERVVRHAACPVLIVREREHEFVETSSTRTGE